MDPVRLTLDQLRELRDDIAPQAARRSRASVRRRLERWRDRIFFIAQCALAAGVAWALARYAAGHHQPFFAPVAAMVCLGFSFGQRLRRVAEVMVGVAVGVGVGDLFVRFFGTGVPQIIFVVALAMSIAVLLGAGTLMTTQAGVQAAIVTTLLPNPGAGFDRWLDAVIGGVVALAAATIAPAAAIRRPRQQASEVLNELSAILVETADGLRDKSDQEAHAEERDERELTDALRRARASEAMLDDLRSAAAEGVAVVRLSPFRRRHRGRVQQIADLVVPLDRAIRNIRVLVRRCAVSVWRDERMPDEYPMLLDRLADGTRLIAESLFEPAAKVAAHRVLGELGRRTADLPLPAGLSAVVVLGQIRSTVVDLLELTGTSYDEARKLVPLRLDGLDEK
ncbi:aromatic acid exporter family protein [Kribbella albertanoniae]|uniref:Aromatic acid exporter family protein n=1 Tax=Kribbella albertanoniae TaxID=1266829 RepID=A0A4R4PLW0_9ACTN|nr:FUSC family protein [Kribbella albertanoniae]TDC22993.1 aromatic acid exporter family protein [Kribbella albertanoniae]